MTISVSGSSTSTVGGNASLVCSASIMTQSDTPRPHFQWFFGPNNGTLPLQTPMTTTNSGNIYTSTLQFSPLSQSQAGMYTCRLGGNERLAARTTLIVNGSCVIFDFCLLFYCLFPIAPLIVVTVTANLNAPLVVGQTGNTLTCDVSGADNLNPTINYQWTRNDGATLTQVGNSRSLPLSPLRLTNAGDYTCNITVSSTLLNNDIKMSADNSQSVIIQSKL